MGGSAARHPDVGWVGRAGGCTCGCGEAWGRWQPDLTGRSLSWSRLMLSQAPGTGSSRRVGVGSYRLHGNVGPSETGCMHACKREGSNPTAGKDHAQCVPRGNGRSLYLAVPELIVIEHPYPRRRRGWAGGHSLAWSRAGSCPEGGCVYGLLNQGRRRKYGPGWQGRWLSPDQVNHGVRSVIKARKSDHARRGC